MYEKNTLRIQNLYGFVNVVDRDDRKEGSKDLPGDTPRSASES